VPVGPAVGIGARTRVCQWQRAENTDNRLEGQETPESRGLQGPEILTNSIAGFEMKVVAGSRRGNVFPTDGTMNLASPQPAGRFIASAGSGSQTRVLRGVSVR
jgi:hypothetical protein